MPAPVPVCQLLVVQLCWLHLISFRTLVGSSIGHDLTTGSMRAEDELKVQLQGRGFLKNVGDILEHNWVCKLFKL